MKIGIVSTWFERGAAYVSLQFKQSLEALGHDVFVYARGGEKFEKNNPKWDSADVTWNNFLFSPVPTDIDRQQFESWIDDNQLESILFNEQQYWQPVVWAKKKNVKCIAYIDYYTPKTVPLFEIYDQVWCNTKRHFSAFQWHKGARYLPWGTDVDIFKPVAGQEVRPNQKVIFFHSAGSSPYRKGTDLVLMAAELLSSRLGKEFKLVVHTQVSLKKFFPDFNPIIKSLEREGVLEIEQRTVSAPGLYHLGDVYVYPSRLEGIGLTIAEALACGLPVITTDEPPMTEFIDEEHSKVVKVDHRTTREDGYYWDMAIADVEDLADKMKLFCAPGFHKNEASQSVRKHALEHLDFAKNMHSINESLEVLTAEPLESGLIEKIDAQDRSLSVFYKSVPNVIRYPYQAARMTKRRIFN